MTSTSAEGNAGLHVHLATVALSEGNTLHCVQVAAPSGGPAEGEGVSPIALSHRLQTALHSMAPAPESGATPLGPEAAARYLLAAHHPNTTMGRARSDSAWCAIDTFMLLAGDVFFTSHEIHHAKCKCHCLLISAEHQSRLVRLNISSLHIPIRLIVLPGPEGAACMNGWEAWPLR